MPWRRDVTELAAGLREWARAEISPDAEITSLTAPDTGNSAETVLFDLHVGGQVEHLVARLGLLDPSASVFESSEIVMQARVMQLVGEHTTVPVPAVRGVVADDALLGVPFLVMTRSSGTAPSDNPLYTVSGWVVDMTADERATMQHHAVSFLARIHSITPETADLSFLERPGAAGDVLDRQVASLQSYYDWACGGTQIPLAERMIEWLVANRPRHPGPSVLSWGDARVGNVLWDGTTPTAVLDWEMASVGPPELDLAWMINIHGFFQAIARAAGLPGLPDLLARDDTAALYTEMCGHRVEHLEWFEVFGALRAGLISARSKFRDLAYGRRPLPENPDDLLGFRVTFESMLTGAYWD